MLSSLGIPLAPCSISLPPTSELGLGVGLGPARSRLWYITLFCEVCSVLQVYAVWCSLLSCCSFRISRINYIFILYVVSGGVLCLTSHTAILNLPTYESFLEFPCLCSHIPHLSFKLPSFFIIVFSILIISLQFLV